MPFFCSQEGVNIKLLTQTIAFAFVSHVSNIVNTYLIDVTENPINDHDGICHGALVLSLPNLQTFLNLDSTHEFLFMSNACILIGSLIPIVK